MKTQLLIVALLFLTVELYAQEIPQLEPTRVGRTFDFSEDFIKRFNSAEAFEDCEKVYNQMNADGRTWEQLTETELEIMKYCDEIKEDVWDIVGGGCSWYCGGGPKSVTASSYLTSQGTNNYEPRNAHDLNYQNAWVEGVDGYGVGELLTYEFAPESPRITEIIVVNGYVKNPNAWNSNSRVKTLRVYYNDEPLADLNLKDIRAEQHFEFQPIGNSERTDFNLLKQQNSWTLKFEILAVYKGTRYSDTVISEIYFDGIDVH
ncbi:MAG: hypothetical protein CMP48_26960 [Rickettsiales bacterium]|nr:hypothetical protein [Rickettsiales bacterium]